MQRAGLDAEDFGPLDQEAGLAVPCNQPIASAVPGLFGSSGPSDVSRLVSLAVVDPIKGMAWAGAAPHVCQERLEAVSPTVTNGNASASVSVLVPPFAIATSVNHAGPRLVFRSPTTLATFPVSGNASTKHFVSQAATTQDVTVAKLRWVGKADRPAVASADKSSASAAVRFGQALDGEAAETVAGLWKRMDAFERHNRPHKLAGVPYSTPARRA